MKYNVYLIDLENQFDNFFDLSKHNRDTIQLTFTQDLQQFKNLELGHLARKTFAYSKLIEVYRNEEILCSQFLLKNFVQENIKEYKKINSKTTDSCVFVEYSKTFGIEDIGPYRERSRIWAAENLDLCRSKQLKEAKNLVLKIAYLDTVSFHTVEEFLPKT